MVFIKPSCQQRQQRVTVLGATSIVKTSFLWPSGVLQVSILGPILYLLYANYLLDVPENLTVACLAYVTKIFCCINSTPAVVLLQRVAGILNGWSSTSGNNFNKLTCRYVRIPRKAEPKYSHIPSMAKFRKQQQ